MSSLGRPRLRSRTRLRKRAPGGSAGPSRSAGDASEIQRRAISLPPARRTRASTTGKPERRLRRRCCVSSFRIVRLLVCRMVGTAPGAVLLPRRPSARRRKPERRLRRRYCPGSFAGDCWSVCRRCVGLPGRRRPPVSQPARRNATATEPSALDCPHEVRPVHVHRPAERIGRIDHRQPQPIQQLLPQPNDPSQSAHTCPNTRSRCAHQLLTELAQPVRQRPVRMGTDRRSRSAHEQPRPGVLLAWPKLLRPVQPHAPDDRPRAP